MKSEDLGIWLDDAILPKTEAKERIFTLAGLSVTREKAELYTVQQEKFLKHIESLKKANVDGLEPWMPNGNLCNVFREDIPEPSLPVDEALKNAPDRRGNYYGVPSPLE